MTLTTFLPSSTEGLMGLWEEQQLSSFSFKGLELGNESPPFKWEWFSEPLDCPSNEGCNPEPMRGTMNPLEGNPRPFRVGRKSVPIMNGTTIGLIIFSIISFFIFILFMNNEIMFFNPILFLMGYRVYSIRVKEHDKSVYIIYKGKLQEGDFILISYLYENVLISN